MSDWPLATGGRFVETTTVTAGDSKAVTVTAHASLHTKGSWVELIAATSHNTTNITIIIQSYLVVGVDDYLIDIAVGASSSEQVIIENLGISFSASINRNGRQFSIPITVPSGSRISCRCQASISSGVVGVVILLQSATYTTIPINKIVTYGADTSDTGGVEIDPGGSANTKGSWVELTAATGLPLKWLAIYIGNKENSVRTSMYGLIDIGVGAAASEQVIISNIPIAAHLTGDLVGPQFIPPIMLDIPEGARIAVRAQVDITDVTDRLFDIVIYGGV